jgi:small-conductance mechanosensitive channel/CRP-like cAMP-binding protein
MPSLASSVLAEAVQERTPYIFAGLLLTVLLARLLAPAATRRRLLHGLWILFLIHLATMPLAGALRFLGAPAYRELRLVSLTFGTLCAIQMAGAVLFTLLLPRVGLRISRIFQEVLTAGASIVAIFSLVSRAGFNMSGLVATSAVLTAVIGFGMRDTLGNVLGGLALQMDDSIAIGDWIKVGEITGRVVNMRWRYTAVETRNWETLIVPNGVLMTEQVVVLGRRQGQPIQWRRWVHFNVDFRFPPERVMKAVVDAVRHAPVENVAAEPPPECILIDLHESYARYAARYWLTDLAMDDPTDSVVRSRIYFALKRAGIPLSIPAHAVFLTEESAERRAEEERKEQARRQGALEQVDLFRPLTEEDRRVLAAGLHYAPFAAGEVLTRQGAEAHWLYLIVEGEVSARVAAEGGLEREVARLKAGDFFGEMALMTGEKRSATVTAVTGVECYRLDKSAFEAIIRQRPAVAEPMAEILARRRLELFAVKGNLDQEAHRRRLAAAKVDLLARIQDFFGLVAEQDNRAAR